MYARHIAVRFKSSYKLEYTMPHPIGYYTSAPGSTIDAAILVEIEKEFGSCLEKLALTQKIV